MDIDGDGFVSIYELEYFYEEQINKLEQLDIEPLPFEDCVCQVLSILHGVLLTAILLSLPLNIVILVVLYFITF